ncbi:UNKNOWN [Stylonychia lemnae]|uniref:Uncharacterized protein n=1 Tax=Stylonychia lemnae TaxID=5949 RepID=A0A078BB06_STYLE|nr:UNKNOWN [Stylonychia lemnae]|eukprot:CDW90422.1 UNKNOWN [Stylonychia lemnae]
MWYFILQLIAIFQNNSSIKSSQKFLDSTRDQIRLNIQNFDFGLFVISPFEGYPNSYENIYRYVNVTASYEVESYEYVNQNGDTYYDLFSKQLKLVKCNENRLFGSHLLKDRLKSFEYDESFCLDEKFEIDLKGKSNFLAFSISSCDQAYLSSKFPGSQCEKNTTKIKQFLGDAYVFSMSIEQYFDTEDFSENPIKVNVNSEIFSFYFDQTKVASYDVQNGVAKVTDSYLHEGLSYEEYGFLQTKLQFLGGYDMPLGTSIKDYIVIRFEMSNSFQVIERQVDNVVQALSNTGGLGGIMLFIVKFLINPLQEFLFYQSLLKKTYLIEKQKIKKNEDLDKQSGYKPQKSFQSQNSKNTVQDSDEEKIELDSDDFEKFLKLIY